MDDKDQDDAGVGYVWGRDSHTQKIGGPCGMIGAVLAVALAAIPQLSSHPKAETGRDQDRLLAGK